MSYNLSRFDDGEILTLSNKTYSEILRLAESNGWNPDGTALVDESGNTVESWDSLDYESHNGQSVNEFDAEEMVEALTRAIQEEQVPTEITADTQEFIGWLSVDGKINGFEIR